MILETQRDIDLENDVANELAKSWNCTHGSMGKFTSFDKFMIRDGKPVALVEIRVRANSSFDKFPNAILDMDKFLSLIVAEITLKLPCFYVLKYTDGIYYVRIGELPAKELSQKVMGRQDRVDMGVKNDNRPVLIIPNVYFKKLL
jgi:hypothetical protein